MYTKDVSLYKDNQLDKNKIKTVTKFKKHKPIKNN